VILFPWLRWSHIVIGVEGTRRRVAIRVPLSWPPPLHMFPSHTFDITTGTRGSPSRVLGRGWTIGNLCRMGLSRQSGLCTPHDPEVSRAASREYVPARLSLCLRAHILTVPHSVIHPAPLTPRSSSDADALWMPFSHLLTCGRLQLLTWSPRNVSFVCADDNDNGREPEWRVPKVGYDPVSLRKVHTLRRLVALLLPSTS
jgi:hypothetical protein